MEFYFNRYRRKRPKVDASIFDSALSHTRRSDASKKREENSVSTFGRFRLWTSFESSPVSVNDQVLKPWLHTPRGHKDNRYRLELVFLLHKVAQFHR